MIGVCAPSAPLTLSVNVRTRSGTPVANGGEVDRRPGDSLRDAKRSVCAPSLRPLCSSRRDGTEACYRKASDQARRHLPF